MVARTALIPSEAPHLKLVEYIVFASRRCGIFAFRFPVAVVGKIDTIFVLFRSMPMIFIFGFAGKY